MSTPYEKKFFALMYVAAPVVLGLICLLFAPLLSVLPALAGPCLPLLVLMSWLVWLPEKIPLIAEIATVIVVLDLPLALPVNTALIWFGHHRPFMWTVFLHAALTVLWTVWIVTKGGGWMLVAVAAWQLLVAFWCWKMFWTDACTTTSPLAIPPEMCYDNLIELRRNDDE